MGLVHITRGLSQGCHVAEVLASMGTAPVLSSLVISSQELRVVHAGQKAGDRMPRNTNKDMVENTCNLYRWGTR